MAALYGGRQIDFITEGDARLIAVDQELMHHVLSNLLSNALKYAPAHLPVICELHYQAQDARLVVRDHGMGIPAEALAHIGEPFYRANNVRSIQGTGLGLALVQKIVQLHRGTMHIDSQLNQGTQITITLPLLQS
jgi:signal transduction histidine kinase